MTKVALLLAIAKTCKKAVRGLQLQTSVQQGDTELLRREPKVHIMRLPKSTDAKKKAPYIIVQYINGRQVRVKPPKPSRTANVRFVFCVYDDDEQTGAINLLNVMDAVEMEILKAIKFGACFTLDSDEPLESLVYPDDTAPYYAGEMFGTFHLPPIEQEVDLFGKK